MQTPPENKFESVGDYVAVYEKDHNFKAVSKCAKDAMVDTKHKIVGAYFKL